MTGEIPKIQANEKIFKTQICQVTELGYKLSSKFPGGQSKKESRHDEIHSVPQASFSTPTGHMFTSSALK